MGQSWGEVRGSAQRFGDAETLRSLPPVLYRAFFVSELAVAWSAPPTLDLDLRQSAPEIWRAVEKEASGNAQLLASSLR